MRFTERNRTLEMFFPVSFFEETSNSDNQALQYLSKKSTEFLQNLTKVTNVSRRQQNLFQMFYIVLIQAQFSKIDLCINLRSTDLAVLRQHAQCCQYQGRALNLKLAINQLRRASIITCNTAEVESRSTCAILRNFTWLDTKAKGVV